jgi:hypothetical protein
MRGRQKTYVGEEVLRRLRARPRSLRLNVTPFCVTNDDVAGTSNLFHNVPGALDRADPSPYVDAPVLDAFEGGTAFVEEES